MCPTASAGLCAWWPGPLAAGAGALAIMLVLYVAARFGLNATVTEAGQLAGWGMVGVGIVALVVIVVVVS